MEPMGHRPKRIRTEQEVGLRERFLEIGGKQEQDRSPETGVPMSLKASSTEAFFIVRLATAHKASAWSGSISSAFRAASSALLAY